MILRLPLPHLLPPLSRQQVVSLSQFSYVSPVELNDAWRGRVRSQIIQPRGSLVLYKSLNTNFRGEDREGVGDAYPLTPFSISCSKV
jgi:hypothetical protein